MAYPRTAAEFNRLFSTEEVCWDYLVKLRWPEGFCCPDCGSPKAWLTSTKLFRCDACESAVSVTAGTIFQNTRKPLRLWFQAMWWVVRAKERGECRRPEPRVGNWQRQDGVDLAPHTAAGDGSPGP